MESLDFQLRLITPAFLAGAMEKQADTDLRHDKVCPRHRLIGRDGDGLRVPSLRGVLRFWYRAMEGTRDTAALARRESAVFGGTETGQGLRLLPVGQSDWEAIEMPDAAGPVAAAGPEAYLGYGPLQYVKDRGVTSHHTLAFRDAIPSGASFSFRALGSRSQLRALERCLVLLHLFGGVGARSRRGWGSVAVDCASIPGRKEQEGLDAWIFRCLEAVWPAGRERPSRRSSEPPYSAFWQDTLARYFNVVEDGRGGKRQPAQYSEVFRGFHEAFRATRLYRNPGGRPPAPIAASDHKLEQDTLAAGRLTAAPQRLAFGFPYNVRFSDKSRLTYQAGYGRGSKRVEISRRSSPLLLKVIEDTPGRFAGIGLFLRSPFFASGDARISAKKVGGEAPPPSYAAVEAYLRHALWQPLRIP